MNIGEGMEPMSNKVEQEVNKIEIPKELHKRSKMGILKAKNEMPKRRNNSYAKGFIAVAVVIVSIGAYILFKDLRYQEEAIYDTNPTMVNEDGSIEIPAIELPEDSSHADMIGLIVYNGKIYTQTDSETDVESAKSLLGEKLGTTKGTIDEWSNQEEYAVEFASTIGVADVYAVKGYDKDFRIMVYDETNGIAEFYECLNGITVSNGSDVFGKLNMINNVKAAQYRTFSDWNNSIENYHEISKLDIVNMFIEDLNNALPVSRTMENDPIGDSRSDEQFRKLIIHLQDGSKVRLTLIEGGYVYYGFANVYFQMEESAFMKMWDVIR
jgi:hypothetical protein